MIIGVDGQDKPDELLRLISNGDVTWPCIRNWESDPNASIEWGVNSWPANFLIDQNQVVRQVNIFEEEKLVSLINDLLRN